MPVTSAPITSTTRPAAHAKPRGGLLALSLVLAVFGSIGWIARGEDTVEGWGVALNMFGRWIGVTASIPQPRGYWLIGLVAISGIIYSRVELLMWRNTVQR